ncbi:uncharacterized protein HKW66_Vig0116540 [Vigna angularis]|uniref:MHD1 domain-containing protein n=1 Tax=Phaseolus angularis TaxID=3914 RepID=A0A8T0JZ42_PHAAN|nr:uncharacterized protein HKW66_Vig0116540 [Vigna angularis]
MGLHARRRDSAPGPFPPLSPTIFIPPPSLTQQDPALDPFPPSIFENRHPGKAHSRRESLPGPACLPLSPPSTSSHCRRDSYPGPFPSPSFQESDSGLLPSTSSSSLNHYYHHDPYSHTSKRRLCLYDRSSDLAWPFQELEGLDHDDIRETAYEVLFTACRSSPGFGGRSAITFYSKHDGNSGGKSPGVTQTSKLKLALGLKMMRSSLSQRVMTSATASTPASPVTERSPRSRSVPRRAMTMAEVMRLQMGVSEQSDSRLRKTLVRTLVGQTAVLDEVEEQLDLIKKTWSTLGINKPIHNVCFAWVMFQQYVETGQTEPDLLCATHATLSEVSNDTKKEKESLYIDILTSMLSSLKEWTDKRFLNYHDHFQEGNIGQIENLLPVVRLATKILRDVNVSDEEMQDRGDKTTKDASEDQIDDYIRSSVKNAFEKMMEAANNKSAESEAKVGISEIMLRMAQETENLAKKEKQSYSLVLKKWHSIAAAVAAMTLNNCYGHVLKQYLSEMTTSETVEVILVLRRAKVLEDVLVQMVVEDSVDCEDGGKTVVREMVPFEVESTTLTLIRKWMDESLLKVRDCFQKAKENEAWNPKSKSEPYAKSVVELMNLSKKFVQEFFQIPISITEDLVQELVDGLQKVLREYIMFVAACGLKENYIPSLPPLTRCNRNSKFHKLWKIASPCSVSCEDPNIYSIYEAKHPHSCTSRGTQRLYIRLNSLHYILSHIPQLDKSLSLSEGVVPSNRHSSANSQKAQSKSVSYFEATNTAILAACQHVSEVASYRLMFFDSNPFFYDSLYVGDVANARIDKMLTILKHNIKLMTAILTERAQELAVKQVMKASFDAFLTVLLAGGTTRVFNESDHQFIQEDFESLKKVFHICGEELLAENMVEKEAEVVEGVIELMGMSTEQLVENLSTLTGESGGVGVNGNGQKLSMPPTTGKWNRTDPNTILRVLCYRNDRVANSFLKRTFQIARRR